MDTILTNSGIPLWLMAVLLIWSLPWKGIALWKAAQLSHKKWFIFLFIVNSFAVIDIIYIYFIARKYTVETIDVPEEK